MANNYNGIAKYYDALSRMVFKKSIVEAQVYLLQFIKDNDKILIIGGGTGWILEELSKLKKENLSVEYVEKSSAMIALSKKRDCKNVSVKFIEQPVEDYYTDKKFDVVFTAFLFDNFPEEKIRFIFKKIDETLSYNSLWLYADFINNKTKNTAWKKLLLKTMYLFFKVTADIETQELTDMQPHFNKNYQQISFKRFYRDFIQSIVYKKL